MSAGVVYDLLNKTADPYGHIAEVRSVSPVHEVDLGLFRFFVVMPYKTIIEVLRDPRSFSSYKATVLSAYAEEKDTIGFSDPPQHTRYRRLVVSAFSEARIESMSAYIEDVLNASLDALPRDGGRFDLIHDVMRPFPIEVICEMLGVPQEHREVFPSWVRAIERSAVEMGPRPQEVHDLDDLLAEMVRDRAKSARPPDDLTTALVRAEVEGEKLTEHEIVDMLELMFVAGGSTTTNATTNTFWLLENNPAERQKFLRDRGLDRFAVEEGLRYDGPIHGLFRRTTRDVELEGVGIPADSLVFSCYGSGSHDPDVYDEPDAFRVDRFRQDPNLPPHLGLGFGIHFCLGANLAKRETAVALRTLYERLEGLRVANGFVPEQVPEFVFRGWQAMELEYERLLPRKSSTG